MNYKENYGDVSLNYKQCCLMAKLLTFKKILPIDDMQDKKRI